MLASMLLLTSCFKDEGNYDYAEMNPPHWLINANNPVSIVARDRMLCLMQASSLYGTRILPFALRRSVMSGL